jgi:hypothetical protein
MIQQLRQLVSFKQCCGIEEISYLFAATTVGYVVIWRLASNRSGSTGRFALLLSPPGHADVACDARKPRGKLLRVVWPSCATPGDGACLLHEVFRRIGIASQICAPSYQTLSLGAQHVFKHYGVCRIPNG